MMSSNEDKKLDVALVSGERDCEDTNTGMFFCGTLKEGHQCNKDSVQNAGAFITGFITTGGCQGRA